MTKGLIWKDKDGPDDFLKYFISITAERKQSHMRRIGVRLLFKHMEIREGHSTPQLSVPTILGCWEMCARNNAVKMRLLSVSYAFCA